eukprot:CAMPEP_0119497112 /NCGR_PEP_ID=MMETSP1344-20130328/20259_1 /TAXON_ID=236787 /ORGANISM="Florenciella parvula, Strain CCMP2471" /LENGTH=185 /DNA_ID=CAMNT_0007532871 /DNA_START=113 /DNA_END=670 /DNA_ORIENTATION=-
MAPPRRSRASAPPLTHSQPRRAPAGRVLDRQGFVVEWQANTSAMAPKTTHTLYQNISTTMTELADNGMILDRERYQFCESWKVPKRGRGRGFRDYFLVPIDWREHHGGSMVISAQAWVETGPPPSFFKRGASIELWGTLRGHGAFRTPPPGAYVVQRDFEATWTGAGARADGLDISLVRTTTRRV